MKIIYSLAILSYFVVCDAQTNVATSNDAQTTMVATVATTVATSNETEYCENQCNDVCAPCQDPIRCTEDQTDCGLSPPDPNYHEICPVHSICVEKDTNCK